MGMSPPKELLVETVKRGGPRVTYRKVLDETKCRRGGRRKE